MNPKTLVTNTAFRQCKNLFRRKKAKMTCYFSAPKKGTAYYLPDMKTAEIGRLLSQKAVFYLKRSDFGQKALPPFAFSCRVLAAAEATAYQGPLFLQARLDLDPLTHQSTLPKEEHLLKKIIKNAVRAGFYNFEINFSGLEKGLASAYRRKFKNYLKFIEANRHLSLAGEIKST